MLRGGDDQLTAQLILELDEGHAICPRGARGDGDLVGENLDERLWDRLVGAGVTDVDLQCDLWKRKRNAEQELFIRPLPQRFCCQCDGRWKVL